MTKLEKHEANWRNRAWIHFSQTAPGSMSWADWFRYRRNRR